MALSQNIGEGGVGTATTSISADWGTVGTQKVQVQHTLVLPDVTAPGTSGGYGDATGIEDSNGVAMANGMSVNVCDTETGALNCHSTNILRLSFAWCFTHINIGR